MRSCESKDLGNCQEPARWEWTLDTSHYAPVLGENPGVKTKLHFCDSCHARRADYQSGCWSYVMVNE